MYGGGHDDKRFFSRSCSDGPRWDFAWRMFVVQVKRVGLDERRFEARKTFRRPDRLGRLFEL